MMDRCNLYKTCAMFGAVEYCTSEMMKIAGICTGMSRDEPEETRATFCPYYKRTRLIGTRGEIIIDTSKQNINVRKKEMDKHKQRLVHDHMMEYCTKCLHLAHNPMECTHPSRVDGCIDFGRVCQCKKLGEFINLNEG